TTPVQDVVGTAELFPVQDPTDRIETRATDFRRHVRGIQPRGNRLRTQVFAQRRIQLAAGLHLRLIGIQLVFNELAGGFDDELLFFSQREVHEDTFFEGAAIESCAQACNSSNCRRSCSTCFAAGQSLWLGTALAVKPLIKVTTDLSTCS